MVFTPQEYQERAMEKEADQELIREWVYRQGVEATRMENGLRGLIDEVGELARAIKKWLEYQGMIDKTNVLEECGDVLWRTCQILKACGFTLEEAMLANLDKLEKVRYKDTICNPHDAAEENRDREAERAQVVVRVGDNDLPEILAERAGEAIAKDIEGRLGRVKELIEKGRPITGDETAELAKKNLDEMAEVNRLIAEDDGVYDVERSTDQ